MAPLQILILLLVAVGGGVVALTREPSAQAIVLSLYGLVLGLMFFIFDAPDVALSQIVIGAVGLPLMLMLTLARLRRPRE